MENENKLTSTPLLKCKPVCFGREKILTEISKKFSSGDRSIFLQGIGGIGKTEIAKHYIKNNRSKYHTVIFATYETNLVDMIISDNYFKFETELNRQITANGSQEDDFTYFKRKLSLIKSASDEGTLIVIDNFDSCDENLDDLLNGNYSLLITTRSDFSRNHSTIKIDPIESTDDLVSLFMHNYGGYSVDEEDSDLIHLFDMVNRHTYTIELLAQHMEKSDQSVVQMIEELEKKGIMSLTETVDDNSNSSQVAYDNLLKMFDLFNLTQEELKILRFLSLMPLTGVSAKDFKNWVVIDSSKLIQDLEKRSWIVRSVNGISLHPIIRDVIRYKLPSTCENSKSFIDRFTETIDESKAWHFTMLEKEKYASIALELLGTFNVINNDTLDFYKSTESLFSFAVKPQNAIDLAIRLYNYSVENYGQLSFASARAAFKIGWAYLFNLQLDNALNNAKQWLQKGYDIFQQIEPNTVYQNAVFGQLLGNLSRVNLLLAEEDGGREMLSCAKTYAEMSVKVNGEWITEGDPSYPKIAGGYMQLADACIALEEYEQAMVLIDDAYRILKDLFGEVDPDTLHAKSRKATVLYYTGKYSEALRIGLENISGYDNFYGELHFGRFEQLLIVLKCHIALGNVDEACKLQDEATRIGEKLFVKKDKFTNLIKRGEMFGDQPLDEKAELLKRVKELEEEIGILRSKQDERMMRELLQSISEQVQKIDTRTSSMDEKLDIIDNRLKDLELWLKSVSDIVERKKASLAELDQSKTEHELEEMRSAFISATAREIANIACRDTASVDYEESQLKGLFGDCWDMLDSYTRHSLISAKVFASNCRKTSYQVLDYSGIIVSATSALENELKLRFFIGYQDYLLKTYGEPSADKWPASMLFTTKKGKVVRNSEFTLGSLPYIFDCSDKDRVTLEGYLKTIVDSQYISNAINSLYSRTSRGHFVSRCENVRVKYRNKAAHTEPVSMELAENCCSDVIGLQVASEHIGQVQGLLLDLVRITSRYGC